MGNTENKMMPSVEHKILALDMTCKTYDAKLAYIKEWMQKYEHSRYKEDRSILLNIHMFDLGYIDVIGARELSNHPLFEREWIPNKEQKAYAYYFAHLSDEDVFWNPN